MIVPSWAKYFPVAMHHSLNHAEKLTAGPLIAVAVVAKVCYAAELDDVGLCSVQAGGQRASVVSWVAVLIAQVLDAPAVAAECVVA